MFSHDRIWAAIDALAARHSLSVSGLAKRAGLDPTTFNKSKRYAIDGRARWPSTESLAKIMEATGASVDEFMSLVHGRPESPPVSSTRPVPLLGFAQAGAGGYFDDGGFPVGQGWDVVEFPVGPSDAVYALEVSGDSMLPLYRDGDTIIVSPGAPVRRGDRVVLRTRDGEVMAKILYRQTPRTVELQSMNPDHPNRTFDAAHIDWIARILWASQ
ncbi:helix-turn-helix transcriptional regulator [Phyllobacterium sp. 21LDTY02-6]|uniref:helix-turn-helix transcriptional regulator n=1 Tax=unclassified Phyllobacterium TaxID=2638441 RepID=UPI00201FD7DC|nr:MULTISPECIES: helix-turn-helix transcriptional regulator [unclassified Phyllobacterium]MCO4318804.1 helix-turn-helix transcriptional regulator [Phyllobacterium sp. 21LDTY02-6]MCX8281927.1 helix-turn-helix transcriptional regulator [Phyllobacterium sp. 0TCS1.6C]MCX8295462.1 helix-turn-helix transcriptional regulator [Phyllobacterium sp. 0TCS1.6A]